MNNTSAQAYLAEHLRERIEVLDPTGTPTYYILQPHKRQHHLVDEFDWDYIAHEVELGIQHNQSQAVAYLNKLREVIGRDMPKNKSGTPIVSDFDLIIASYTQRATAMKESGIKI